MISHGNLFTNKQVDKKTFSLKDHIALATAEAALVPDLATSLNSFHGVHRLTATNALLKLRLSIKKRSENLARNRKRGTE